MFGPGAGGVNTSLNITAAAVIKAAPGALVSVTVSGVPTAGALTFNDALTVAAATTANQIVSIPFGSFTGSTATSVLSLNGFPALTGIVISAVPTGSVVTVAYS